MTRVSSVGGDVARLDGEPSDEEVLGHADGGCVVDPPRPKEDLDARVGLGVQHALVFRCVAARPKARGSGSARSRRYCPPGPVPSAAKARASAIAPSARSDRQRQRLRHGRAGRRRGAIRRRAPRPPAAPRAKRAWPACRRRWTPWRNALPDRRPGRAQSSPPPGRAPAPECRSVAGRSRRRRVRDETVEQDQRRARRAPRAPAPAPPRRRAAATTRWPTSESASSTTFWTVGLSSMMRRYPLVMRRLAPFSSPAPRHLARRDRAGTVTDRLGPAVARSTTSEAGAGSGRRSGSSRGRVPVAPQFW